MDGERECGFMPFQKISARNKRKTTSFTVKMHADRLLYQKFDISLVRINNILANIETLKEQYIQYEYTVCIICREMITPAKKKEKNMLVFYL